MPKHNPTDDVMSREAAETRIADIIANQPNIDANSPGVARELAKAIVDSFAYVETDRERSSLRGGQKVNLRRLVLTGAWEVDPAAPAGEGKP
jgi:hypothetical protein